MKIEEYENIMKTATGDNAPIVLTQILDELKKDKAHEEALEAENAKNTERIRNLQDTNMKLFLSIAAPEKLKEDEPEEKTGQEAINDFINNILKEGD